MKDLIADLRQLEVSLRPLCFVGPDGEWWMWQGKYYGQGQPFRIKDHAPDLEAWLEKTHPEISEKNLKQIAQADLIDRTIALLEAI